MNSYATALLLVGGILYVAAALVAILSQRHELATLKKDVADAKVVVSGFADFLKMLYTHPDGLLSRLRRLETRREEVGQTSERATEDVGDALQAEQYILDVCMSKSERNIRDRGSAEGVLIHAQTIMGWIDAGTKVAWKDGNNVCRSGVVTKLIPTLNRVNLEFESGGGGYAYGVPAAELMQFP